MTTDWLSYAPLLLRAAGTTLWLSWLAMLLGVAAGFGVALARVSPWRPLRVLALAYTEFWRSIPILIVMFFAYFGLPLFLGQDLPPFAAATIALALHASASMSEVIRAGIESVGRGQWEAARAFGFRYARIMQLVVLPQAVRVIVPPSVGVFITVLKESTLASIIGYIELTKTGLLIRDSTDGGFVPLLALAAIYFVINYAISLGGRWLELRFDAGRRPAPAGAMA